MMFLLHKTDLKYSVAFLHDHSFPRSSQMQLARPTTGFKGFNLNSFQLKKMH